MSNKNSQMNRNSKILVGKLGSIMGPAFAAEICTILSILVDSVVGQHYIDNRTVAAIALLSTFMTAVSAVHDLLGTSVTPLIVEAKCEHGDREASRTLGDILFIIGCMYIGIILFIFVISRPFLGIITDDEELIGLALKYYYPILFMCPLNELLFCTERAFKTEGNVGFFSMRMVITNVVNILLDIFFVAFMKKGIEWLAYATVISTLLGYVWSMSYGFRKDCRIYPDFSKTLKKDRLQRTFKSQMKIGTPFFTGDLILIAVTAYSNMLILSVGGTMAMACTGVLTSICSITFRFNNVVITNSNILFNALYIEDDYHGIRMTLKAVLTTITTISLLFIAVITVFYIPLGTVYAVTDPAELKLMRVCFLTNGFCILWNAISQFIRTFLISVKKEKQSTVYTAAEKLNTLALLFLASLTGRIELIWLAIGWGSGLCSVFTLIIFRRDKNDAFLYPVNDDQAAYSLLMETDSIVEATRELDKILEERKIDRSIRNKTVLLVEETGVVIAEENKEKSLNADIRIRENADRISIYIYYDGKALSAEEKIKSGDVDIDDCGITLISKLSSEFRYTRIVGLNCIELNVPKPKD